MFRNGRNNRCKSVNMTKCRDNKLHVVELTLSDVGPLNIISPPVKYEMCIRQQENYQRPCTEGGPAEILIDDDVRTLPHYPSDNALNSEGEIYDGQPHSANILNNQRKSNHRNSRYQVAPETDNGNRPVRPYRPISSHQYLTSTELKDSTINEKNVHLGRPTRTTLLRERQRRRSVPAVDVSHNLQQQKGGQKLDPRIPTRYEAVKTILSSMIPPGQSLHSFISGARYNRSNWIETIGSLDLASDLPAMGVGGSSLNTPHQKHQKPISEQQLDADNTPRAPPESPVDFNNTTVREGSTGAFLPVLSAGGPGSVADPTSPLPPQKQVPDSNRSRKIAWDEEIKRLSPLPDRAASTQEKVRFQTEEPVTAGGNPHAVHHERTHHAVRPSSVRAPTTQVVKPGRDMAAVVIHGISLHGAPTAREASSYPHALSDQTNPDGMRRSWSATTYTASGSRPPQVEFNRLDSLKVTGVKVSGSTPDSGRVGLRLSALKPWRLENDAESTEALVGSRCEVFSDRGTGAVTAQDANAAAAATGSRSDAGNDEKNRELNFNFNDDEDEDAGHEVDSVEDVHPDNNFGKDSEKGSREDIMDHEIKSNEDIDHDDIKSNEDAIDHDINEDVDHEVKSNRVTDFDINSSEGFNRDVIVSKGNKDHSKDSETIERYQGKQSPSRLDQQHLSPDQLSEADRDDLESVSSMEQGQVKPDKPNQVNLRKGSRGYDDTDAAETGRVNMDDVSEELGQVGTRELESGEGQDEPPELGRVSVLDDESWKEEAVVNDDDGDKRKNSGGTGKEAEDGVVFFITEDQLNNAEKLDAGLHDHRVTKDTENNEAEEEEEWEINSDSARKDDVNGATNFIEEGIMEDVEIMVTDRSVISPDEDTSDPTGYRSVNRRN